MAGKGGTRSTSWRPGRSGNPRGRPKVVAEVRDLARQYTGDAVATLANIMSNPKISAAARVSAATALLDRGWGKPQQPIQADVNVVPPEVQERQQQARQTMLRMLDDYERRLALEHHPTTIPVTETRERLAQVHGQKRLPETPPPPEQWPD